MEGLDLRRTHLMPLGQDSIFINMVTTITTSFNTMCLLFAAVSSAGYKFLASQMKQQEEPDAAQTAQDSFLVQLDEVENQLSRHSGPYLVG